MTQSDDPEANKALREALRGASEFLLTGSAPQLSIVGEPSSEGPPSAVEPEFQNAVEVVATALLDWQILDGYEVASIIEDCTKS